MSNRQEYEVTTMTKRLSQRHFTIKMNDNEIKDFIKKIDDEAKLINAYFVIRQNGKTIASGSY